MLNELRSHKWDGDLDRMEEFAATFGDPLTKRLDAGFIAMGSALGALFALILG